MQPENLPATRERANEQTAVAAHIPPGATIMTSPELLSHQWRVATCFARSSLVPKHLQGKQDDCMLALMVASSMKEDPLTVMQNIVIINGTAGWKTQYMIARANRSGIFRGRINWRCDSKKGEVTAYATLAETNEEVSATASMTMAKAEGWTKNAKYNSMPEHMLKWRSATMLIRLYAPEVMLGMNGEEELHDTAATTTPVASVHPAPEDLPPAGTLSAAPTEDQQPKETDEEPPVEFADPETGEIIDAEADTEAEDVEFAEEEPAQKVSLIGANGRTIATSLTATEFSQKFQELLLNDPAQLEALQEKNRGTLKWISKNAPKAHQAITTFISSISGEE